MIEQPHNFFKNRSHLFVSSKIACILQKKAGDECHTTKQLYSTFMETERTFVKARHCFMLDSFFSDLGCIFVGLIF